MVHNEASVHGIIPSTNSCHDICSQNTHRCRQYAFIQVSIICSFSPHSIRSVTCYTVRICRVCSIYVCYIYTQYSAFCWHVTVTPHLSARKITSSISTSSWLICHSHVTYWLASVCVCVCVCVLHFTLYSHCWHIASYTNHVYNTFFNSV